MSESAGLSKNKEQTEISDDYCNICRFTHMQGKKHLHTNRHKTAVEKILRKEEDRVADCQVKSLNPTVTSPAILNKKVWCNFCCVEIEKDLIVDGVCVELLALAKHLVQDKHQKNMYVFCRENRAKFTPAKLMLTEDVIKQFNERSKPIKEKFIQQAEQLREKAVSTIRHIEDIRKANLEEWENEGSASTSQTHDVHQPGCSSNGNFNGQKYLNGQSHLIPPWLMDDDDDDETPDVIGPNEEEFKKYLADQERKKLPKARVGASYAATPQNQQSSSAVPWFPAYGGVWNKHRRNKKRQFEFQHKQNNKKQHMG